MIFLQYKTLYPEYFEQGSKYVYGSVGKWIVVYKKAFFTKTDENRENIYDATYAEYRANKLIVQLIIEKQHPEVSLSTISFNHFNEIVVYNVGKAIKPIKSKIVFYKSYIIAYYTNLLSYSDNIKSFSESYFSWYANGRRSSEGQYLNGEMHGNWIFWYHFTDTKRQPEKSFVADYLNGYMVSKTEYLGGKIIRDGLFSKPINKN